MTLSGLFKVRKDEKDATKTLARLNREMALELIAFASETGEKRPLIDAVKSLRSSQELYSPTTTPIENAQLHKKLGDVLMKIGKTEDDMESLDYAIIAYRGAITIASLLGAHQLRKAVRKNYALARNLRGVSEPKASMSLMGAA